MWMMSVESNTERLSGRVALVTGGGRGLGFDIAKSLRAAGAQVAICSRYADIAESAAVALDPSGVSVMGTVCDIRDEQAVAEMVAAVEERFGRIDVLVNNSGSSGPTSMLWESSLEQWQDTLATNVTGVFLCSRAVLPGMMRQSSGSIVNVGSVSGKRPNAGRAAYSASKTALIGLTRTLAWEVGAHGIRVNLVTPGAIDSPRFQKVIDELAQKRRVPREAILKEAVSGSPLGRLVQPEELASTVVFLASDSASAITGEDINVSAGLAMY
jgi:NAD(P)-dependent dehydrogenase (short-subunit alcohol dehydrogenase family)